MGNLFSGDAKLEEEEELVKKAQQHNDNASNSRISGVPQRADEFLVTAEKSLNYVFLPTAGLLMLNGGTLGLLAYQVAPGAGGLVGAATVGITWVLKGKKDSIHAMMEELRRVLSGDIDHLISHDNKDDSAIFGSKKDLVRGLVKKMVKIGLSSVLGVFSTIPISMGIGAALLELLHFRKLASLCLASAVAVGGGVTVVSILAENFAIRQVDKVLSILDSEHDHDEVEKKKIK